MTQAELQAFLVSQRYGVVSSLSNRGTPQSALVGIAVTPALEIIFDTLNTTRKFANMQANPKCSIVIGWDNERTVQYEGSAFLPTGEELHHYQQIYFSAWPEGPTRLTWPGIEYVVVRPRWIRYSDFNLNPPLVNELTFEPLPT
jgi:pyridoxine/pyridoxamine 5'-phosphate oxidase